MMMIIIMDGKIINDKHKLFIKILINIKLLIDKSW